LDSAGLQKIPNEKKIVGVPNLGNYGELLGNLSKDAAVDVGV
jgi:hypothetical protein